MSGRNPPIPSAIIDRRSFYALLSVIFLDNLGLIIVYPIFTPLVLKPNCALLPPETSLSLRLILLGVLIASFPIAQFLGGPFIGHFSDSRGKKRAFHLALIGEFAGFSLSAFALLQMNYPLLLFSRFLTGLFAGNLTICLATIAENAQDVRLRSTQFGIVSSLVGISFVVAILIGGVLSSPKFDALFSSSLPFWVMALLTLINLGIIQFGFTEEKLPRNPSHPIKDFLSVVKEKKIATLYVLFFFFMLGWTVSLQFLSTFILEHYWGTKKEITGAFITVGLAWCIGTIFINRLLLKRFTVSHILLYTLPLSCACLFAASEIRHFLFFLHFIFFTSLFASLAWSNCLALISKKAPPKVQGKLLGVNQSMATLSMIFAPLFGGMIGTFDIRIIYLTASASLLISTTLLIYNKIKNHF